jgi:hypothetical protein
VKKSLVVDLNEPDLRRVPKGTIVITTKGFKFKLLKRDKNGKEAWKDLTSGVTWFDKEDGCFTHYEAVEKFGDSLPTKEEFQLGFDHGIEEVLPNSNECYWSASVISVVRQYAWCASSGARFSASIPVVLVTV